MKPALYMFVPVLYHVPRNTSQSLLVVTPLFHYCLNAVRCDSAQIFVCSLIHLICYVTDIIVGVPSLQAHNLDAKMREERCRYLVAELVCRVRVWTFFSSFLILLSLSKILSLNLTHCGRVTQICVYTLQLCKTDDANLRF